MTEQRVLRQRNDVKRKRADAIYIARQCDLQSAVRAGWRRTWRPSLPTRASSPAATAAAPSARWLTTNARPSRRTAGASSITSSTATHPSTTTCCCPEGADARFADSAALWNAAEAAEKRKDAQVAREIVLALPVNAALSDGDRTALTRPFAEQHFVARDRPKHGGSTKAVARRHPDRQASPVPATDGQRAHRFRTVSAVDVPYTHLVVRSGNTVQSQTGSRGTAASLGREHAVPAPLCRGMIETTEKMVVAGALACALSSADEARGDPSRLQRHKRPRGPMAPDQTTAGGPPPAGAAATEIPEITGHANYAPRLDY